jgi:hypothetical protein
VVDDEPAVLGFEGRGAHNSSFCRWPGVATFRGWRRRLPDAFQFSVKAPRGLTHAKKLYAPEVWVERIAACWHDLGDKRAVLLVQLAPDHARRGPRHRCSPATTGPGIMKATAGVPNTPARTVGEAALGEDVPEGIAHGTAHRGDRVARCGARARQQRGRDEHEKEARRVGREQPRRRALGQQDSGDRRTHEPRDLQGRGW